MASSLIGAYRDSTNSQWEYVWRKFQRFVINRELAIINKSVTLDFLHECFVNEKLSPKTIQVYKGALAIPLREGFGINTADQEFSLLIRAQFIERPPTKKILPKWSLDKVFGLIQNSDDNSDDFLLKKSLFLTTLATGNRANEISALTRSSILMEENPSKLTIPVKPKFLFKNQRLDRTPPNVVVRSLNAEVSCEKLCPVATIKEYLIRSKEWNKTDAVFCSRARVSALKSPDVSLHICRLIELACPGTIPRGHDVRKIGTSLAWCRGLSPQEIVERVFWSSSSVFISSYLSPVDSTVNCVAVGTTA